jgi:hypothetical protein
VSDEEDARLYGVLSFRETLRGFEDRREDVRAMSQTCSHRGYRDVAASTDTVVGVRFNEAGLANEAETDLETIFRAEYKRIARVIARVSGPKDST